MIGLRLPASGMIALLIATAPLVGQQVQQNRRVEPRTPSDMGLHGYSMVLVTGDMQAPGTGGDSVPSAARKALTDMQAFLPFKRYQLVDAAWMLCCGGFRATTGGKIRGPVDQEYSYSIETLHSTDDGKLTVRFLLREEFTEPPGVASGSGSARGGSGQGSVAVSEATRAEYARQRHELTKERDDAEIEARRAEQMRAKGTMSNSDYEAARMRAQRAKARLAEFERTTALSPEHPDMVRPGRSTRTVMDSTFSIALGETVVIGTSRIKGDQALIALLTAASRPGTPR